MITKCRECGPGMGVLMGRLMFVVMLVWPVASVAADVTCTGVLVVGENEELIVDADRTCSVSTRGSGHDPLKPCTLGQQCRSPARTAARSTSSTHALRRADAQDRRRREVTTMALRTFALARSRSRARRARYTASEWAASEHVAWPRSWTSLGECQQKARRVAAQFGFTGIEWYRAFGRATPTDPHVRYWHLADICLCAAHVCF